MVCPNCHSKQIVSIQDQQFCINCGQAIPIKVAGIKRAVPSSLRTQSNGLPEGVTILDPTPAMDSMSAHASEPSPIAIKKPTETMAAAAVPSIVKKRSRIMPDEPTVATATDQQASTPIVITPPAEPLKAAPKPRKRKVGRPKAGRLDVPRITQLAPNPKPKAKPKADPKPEEPAAAPEIIPTAQPTDTAGRHLSDIRPAPRPAKPQPPVHHVHHVGVATLHFGSVLMFALRARTKHHHVAMASLGAGVLAAVSGAGVWLAVTNQLDGVAHRVLAGSPTAVSELVILAVLYYIGRSIGQAAIIYGVVKEADSRPAGLAVQLGVAVNTFMRRLALDVGFGLAELVLITGISVLVITGGANWGINTQVHMLILFVTYLGLLYSIAALAVAHGLGNVAIVLTKRRPWAAFELGWQLFAHRMELIGIRLIAGLMEAVLALPLAAAAVGLYLYVPRPYEVATGIAIALVAWVAGSMAGAGTATWWAAVYRKIVLLDHPKAALELLASRQPVEANRLILTWLVGLCGALLAATVFLPFLG